MNGRQQTYFDSIVLNGETYFDVVQSEIDSSSNNLNEDILFWRVMGSKTEGVIYFENKRGKQYFLKE